MTTTAPVGICSACGTGFGAGTAFCVGCGAPVHESSHRGVLAERVAATPVYGAPPLQIPGIGPVQEYQAPPAPPRRRTRLVLGAVALVIALVAAGLWVSSYLRSRPVTGALDDATAAYGEVLAALNQAQDLDGVRSAGHRATALRTTLIDHERGLADRKDALAAAAYAVVRGEREVVEAAATLSGLSETELALWGQAEQQLVVAGEHLTAARAGLARADDDRAGDVDDPTRAIDHTRTVVGESASRLLNRSVAALVGRLGSVSRSGQLRRIAADAAEQRATVTAAQPGLAGDSAAAVQAAGTAYDQLALLSTFDVDHLGVWKQVRGPLSETLARLAGVDAASGLTHVDAFVADAKAKVRAWKKAVREAKTTRREAEAQLAGYETPVRAQLVAYDALRAIGADFGAAQLRREAILGALSAVVAPPAYSAQQVAIHAALVGEISVLSTVYSVQDAAGWAAFDAAWNGAHAAMNAAVAAWSSAITQAREQLDVPLPQKPVV